MRQGNAKNEVFNFQDNTGNLSVKDILKQVYFLIKDPGQHKGIMLVGEGQEKKLYYFHPVIFEISSIKRSIYTTLLKRYSVAYRVFYNEK